MKMFFYCMREFDELPIARELAARYGIELTYTTAYPSLDNAHLCAGCEAVSITPCPVGEDLLTKWQQLGVKIVTAHSIGFDHIDLQAAKRLGLRVSNVTYPPDGVADYALMLILMCLRRASYILKCAELQDYTLRNKIGCELGSCTVGVIGTGSIGAAVVKRLQAFGCRVLAYDIRPRTDLCTEYVTLERLYAESDVITLHAPLTAENRHMVCAETIATMKDGVCIVNTARGGLIDTAALLDGLYSKKIGSAALDVMEDEAGLYYAGRMYDVIDNRHMAQLRACPNVILTPHTAFYTLGNVRAMVEGNLYSAFCLEKGLDDPHRIV